LLFVTFVIYQSNKIVLTPETRFR